MYEQQTRYLNSIRIEYICNITANEVKATQIVIVW